MATDLAFPNVEEALLAARCAVREQRFSVARAICDHVLASGQEPAAACLILARISLKQRAFEQAEAHLHVAAAHAAHAPELFDLYAELCTATGRHEQAAAHLEKYRATSPPSLPLALRLARADILADRPEAAIDLLTAALDHYPDEAALYDLLCETCLRGRRWSEAARWARASLRLNPANPRRQLALLDAAARLLDFESIRTHCAGLLAAMSNTRAGDGERIRASLVAAADLRPMHAALYFASDSLTRRAAEQAVAKLGVASSPGPPRRARAGRIRIGYLSGDFNDHPLMQLMRGFFRLHDTSAFDVHLFSYGPDDGTRYRRELKERHANFVDLEHETDTAAAEIIRRRDLDVLIDLKGWTRGTRMGICARRPAPVQIGYLGFPGTYGAEFIDHIVVDRVVVPDSAVAQYRETLLYMPACYMVSDNSDPVARAPTRRAFGLADDSFVLCSFNRSLKISEENLRAWLEILARAPRAVLWMGAASDAERGNIRRFAQSCGVAAERVVFADRVADKAAHLARLGLADLALDTWRYNGHTGTIDALWAGVPVLAKTGTHFASRVSESVLAAAGLSALVARSAEDYVEMACAFANGVRDIAPLRATVTECRRSSPLFDTAGFTRDFLALVARTVR